ncbi:OmpA family protein [Massilia sp. CT11-108]|uniref:OmpA family protein n=1 Tax=Massilia sp. CT11-108 TaxID=3393900 RepID=UPI0039A5AD34
MKTTLIRSTLCATAFAVAATGCADMSQTQRGTATGAGVGAGLGAILGATTGGAVLGAAAGAVVGNVWSRHMEQQRQQMEQATRGTGVQVSQTSDNRLKLEIPSDVSFDTNRSDIKPNFRPILDRFAQTLNENPATNVTIIGHTDNTGSDQINQPLSLDRAAHTRDYLTARGINPARITVEGRASREPIANNDDPAGRARNRRVEIYVSEPARQG